MINKKISVITNLILENKPFIKLPPGIHGKIHAYKVFLLANTIANLHHQRKKLDLIAITISALLHDCGRDDDNKDPLHGLKSFKKVIKFIKEKNIKCNKKLIKECIVNHCCSPSQFKEENHSIEAKIVRDADRLDRFRFIHQDMDLNPFDLQLEESKILMDISSGVNGHKWRSH